MSYGGGNGFNNLMRQAQKMQQEMLKRKEAVGVKEFEGTAGGGMVTAKVNGNKAILAIKIEASVIDPKDAEMLQDMIVAALNQALQKADEAMKAALSEVTGGVGIPGMM